MCQFGKAWMGQCKAEGEPFCAEHIAVKCSSCGAQATRECAETGQFVCGCPLCDDCEHATAPDGTNGGIGFYSTIPKEMLATWKTHIKKSEQKYQPWYMREGAPTDAAN